MSQFTAFVLWTISASLVMATAACSGRVQSDSRAADEAAIREALGHKEVEARRQIIEQTNL